MKYALLWYALTQWKVMEGKIAHKCYMREWLNVFLVSEMARPTQTVQWDYTVLSVWDEQCLHSFLLEDTTFTEFCQLWRWLCSRMVDPIFEQKLRGWYADWPFTLLQVGWEAFQSWLVLCVQWWLKFVTLQCCASGLWWMRLFWKKLRSLVSTGVIDRLWHSS